MDPAKASIIELIEVAYDLDARPAEWAPRVMEAGAEVFDLGLGAAATVVRGAAADGQPMAAQVLVGTAGPRFMEGMLQAAHTAGPKVVADTMGPLTAGTLFVLSELREAWPHVFNTITEHTGAHDVLGLWAMDPDYHGLQVTLPSPKPIELSRKARQHWRMLAVHIAAGYRLRRKVIETMDVEGATMTDIPLNAEALIDPKRFLVSEAAGGAQQRSVSEQIREAAVRVDRARGRLRRRNPEEALQIWHGLVRGRWSLVDWFDTDGRRFVLAKPNAPHLGDPRGLSEREHQVATYAARGESNKLIAYRFGLSEQRVSTVLRSAMRKLGTKTRAQLVDRMRGFPSAVGGDVDEQDAAG